MFCRKCGKELKDGAAFCGNCGAQVSATNVHTEQSTQQPRTQEAFRADSEKYTSKKKPKRMKAIVATAMIAVLAVAGVAFANQSGIINVPFLPNSNNSAWVLTECSAQNDDGLLQNVKLEYDDAGNCTTIKYSTKGFSQLYHVGNIPGIDVFFNAWDGKNSEGKNVNDTGEFNNIIRASCISFKVENDYDKDGVLTSGHYIAGCISLPFNVTATKNEEECVTSYSVSPTGEATHIVSNPTTTSVISYKYDTDQETILEVSDNSEHLFSLQTLQDNGIFVTRDKVNVTLKSIFGDDNKPTSLSYKVPSWDYDGAVPVESDNNGNISKISLGDAAYTFNYKRVENPSVNAKAFSKLLGNFLCPRS